MLGNYCDQNYDSDYLILWLFSVSQDALEVMEVSEVMIPFEYSLGVTLVIEDTDQDEDEVIC